MPTCTLRAFYLTCFFCLFLSSTITFSQPTLVQSCTLTPYDSGDHAFWLNQIPGDPSRDYVFDSLGGTIDFFSDSTARITGRILNIDDSTRQWDAEVWLIHQMTYADWTGLGRNLKNGGGADSIEQQDWIFYEMDSTRATLFGVPGMQFDGDTLYLTHRPANLQYGFQYGFGANDKNGNYGMSGWFYYDGSYSGKGDINVNLECDTASPPPPPPICTLEIDTVYASCKTDSTFEMVVAFSGIGNNFQITDDQGSAAMTGLSAGTHIYGEYFNSTDVMLTIQDTSVANCLEGTPPMTADCTPVPVCDIVLDTVYTECLTDTTFGVVIGFTATNQFSLADDQGTATLDSISSGLYAFGIYPQGTEVELTLSHVELFSCVEYIGPLTDTCSVDTASQDTSGMMAARAAVGNIYPNPIQAQSHVLIDAERADMAFSWLLVDGSARVRKQGTQLLIEGPQVVDLDLEGLQPGLYFLKLVIEDEILSAQRIVITE
ncbi:MAG: T9SS type A sorting domain-containing protein [Bacteroidota bacterium]